MFLGSATPHGRNVRNTWVAIWFSQLERLRGRWHHSRRENMKLRLLATTAFAALLGSGAMLAQAQAPQPQRPDEKAQQSRGTQSKQPMSKDQQRQDAKAPQSKPEPQQAQEHRKDQPKSKEQAQNPRSEEQH